MLGPHHPDLAITLYNLACCAEQLGDVGEAIAQVRCAVELLDAVVADSQPTLVACRAKLQRLLVREEALGRGGGPEWNAGRS